MENPIQSDFEKTASRVYDVLSEIGYTDPKEYSGSEVKKQWVDAVASVVRSEMGYDEAD
jgi:hypothetical protein